jgi:hypothetical protein
VVNQQQKPGVVRRQRPIAKVSQSLRLVEPRQYLKDDTESPLHQIQVWDTLVRFLEAKFCG